MADSDPIDTVSNAMSGTQNADANATNAIVDNNNVATQDSSSILNVPLASEQNDVVVNDDDDTSKTADNKQGENETQEEMEESVEAKEEGSVDDKEKEGNVDDKEKEEYEDDEKSVDDIVRSVLDDILVRVVKIVADGSIFGRGKYKERRLFMIEMYKNLPLDWNGAPEFQWKLLKDDTDRRVVVFENVLPSDIYEPWFYSALLRAKRVTMEFPRSSGKVEAVFTNMYGRVEAYFQSDHPIAYCAVNNLVHIRTVPHRMKIYLPQTKWLRRYQEILEARMGRLREPMESMRYLILKPIGDEITEEQIRDVFRNHTIESIRFERDSLEQRLAILLFPTARQAIAAHSINDFVHFGTPTSLKDYIKVYFPNVDFHGWDKLTLPTPDSDNNYLLTYKEFNTITQAKKFEMEQEKIARSSASMETKQARLNALKEHQEKKRIREEEKWKAIIGSICTGAAERLGSHSVEDSIPMFPDEVSIAERRAKEDSKSAAEGDIRSGDEDDIMKPPDGEGIRAAEKNVPMSRKQQSKQTFPKKSGRSSDSKRSADDDISNMPRKRRRGGRYRRRRYSRSESSGPSSFRNIPPFSLPPAPAPPARYGGGGGYRIDPWRRPPQPAPFPYGPAFDSYGYADARRRKPPGKLPIMDVGLADAPAPPPRPAVPLNELSMMDRRKEMDFQEHFLRQQKVMDDLAKKLSTKSNAPPDYMRHDPYAPGQGPNASSSSLATTSTSKMPAWVTPSIYSQSHGEVGPGPEAYEAWR